MTAPVVTRKAALADLLARVARGDLDAFLAFYDATRQATWRLELCRHRDPARAQQAASDRYLAAWILADGYPHSGLSPLAWLLSLAVDG